MSCLQLGPHLWSSVQKKGFTVAHSSSHLLRLLSSRYETCKSRGFFGSLILLNQDFCYAHHYSTVLNPCRYLIKVEQQRYCLLNFKPSCCYPWYFEICQSVATADLQQAFSVQNWSCSFETLVQSYY
ncbi:hypothetical protein FGO68_gene12818 [Halteria grandinella]|uniref:Uncharacterized protein n=1 Tax=Halteria grandinella TaxID=5974 RepID=A0A8J8NZB0_HALGN|nr:hypothetical protein FGO68_gene12818 [Halteria grandinella]